MKNIAIVEPHYHSSYLHASVQIAECSGLKITVYTTKDVWKEAKEFFSELPNAKIFLFENIEVLLRTLISDSGHFDIVAFNTIQILEWQNLVRIAFGVWKCPIVLTLHNPVYWFEHPGYPLYRLRAKLRLICRNRILKKSAGLIFLGEKMLPYAHAAGYSKPVCLLPYGIYDRGLASTNQDSNQVVFAVLGTINEHRDYEMLLRVFKEVLDEPGKKLGLRLLGAPYREHGEKIIKECKRLRDKGLSVKYWRVNYLSEADIRNEVADVDFIVLLLSKSVFSDGLKVSGTFFDAVRFKKPFLVPDFYPIPAEAVDGSMMYGTEKELCDLIRQCREMDSNSRSQIQETAELVAENYTPAKWAPNMSHFLEEILR